MKPTLRMSSTESVTLPISERRTGAPLCQVDDQRAIFIGFEELIAVVNAPGVLEIAAS